MDISRLKKVLAGISVAAVTLTQVGTAIAAYSDVPGGVWYEEAVEAFLDAGYLDATQPRFRGGDTANRAEFVKLVVELNGGILSTPPAVPSFDDVATSAWYYGYMEEAAREGWVKGDSNCYGSHPCRARPGSNINRAEAGALIVRAFGLEATGDAPQFVDNPSGQWYTADIQTAADNCVLQGDDSTGRVRPADNMNRAEMVVMLHRVDQGLAYGVDCGTEEEQGGAAGITDAVAMSSTTIELEFNVALDVEAAEDTDHYSVTGAGELDISSAVVTNANGAADLVELTLAQAMSAGEEYTVSVSDLMTEDGDTFSDSESFNGYTTIVKGDGILEGSVSASNPVGDSVPQGAVGVVLLSMDLSASCDDSITIEDLTLLHEGFGAVGDISGVYAAIDGARVTRKRTIDSEDQTSELRFSAPLVINACDTVTVDFVADFSSSATTSAEHNFVIELPSDLISNAKEVTGNFPRRGNTFRIAAVDSGIVSISYRTVSPDEVEVGDKGVVIGKFEISTDSTEDQTFYSMTFEQNSSASDGDVTNIAIRRTDGTVLTNTVAQTVGDFVTLVFDPPFTVLEGDKITLEIIADIAAGAGDTIIMHFEESSDIFAVGSLYGYGVNGQLYGSQIALPTETASLPDTVTIDAGEFTVEISGPAQQSYTRDDNDAVLANIIFTTGGERVDIKDLFILVQGTTSSGFRLSYNNGTSTDNIHEVLEDVEIRNKVTGRTIDGVRLTTSSDFGQSTTGSGTFQVYRFDDFIVNGKETWEFRTDFIDNGSSVSPRSGDRFRIHICGEPTHITGGTANTTGCSFGGLITSATTYQMSVEGVSTGDRVLDVRPRGNIAGNFHRIANASLTVAVKAIGTGDTAVQNAKNVNLLRFEARAGEAEDILFTKAVFSAKSGSLVNANNYTLWVDSDGDGKVDTVLEDGIASQSSQVTFADLAGGGFVVPKEETVIFEVHSDISSSLTNNDLLLQFDTGSTIQNSYLEAEELDDGSSLSGINTDATCQQDTDATAEANCDITVTTTESQLWNLIAQGDLFVTKDSTPVKSRQLLGGTLGEAVLRLQFHAENEPIDVTDLQLTSSGGIAGSVDRLELYKEGESTFFALATIGGCGSDAETTLNSGGGSNHNQTVVSFCANMETRQLVVPEGSDVDVIVRPRMKNDVGGATSADVIGLFVDHTAASNNSTGTGAIRARGDESSNNLTANDGDTSGEGEVFIGTATATTNSRMVGNRNESVLAKIISITNANPDPNGTNVPTGTSPVGQFKFSAAAHTNSKNGLNDAVLSGIIFNVIATNVGMNGSGFQLYNKADSTTKQQCHTFEENASTDQIMGASRASGSFVVVCRHLDTAAINTEIDQGSDLTLVLEGVVNNAQVSSTAASTLQVSFQNFTTLSQKIFGHIVSTRSRVEWVDKDTASTSFFWIEYPETVIKSTSYQS
ncbi:S-layer homology domain-containing protein [Candidatus Peregrinibacteria bacterium]|nr:S-layer homology domain-containing protein [Candidatus Peregrinibacteria bacterium]